MFINIIIKFIIKFVVFEVINEECWVIIDIIIVIIAANIIIY